MTEHELADLAARHTPAPIKCYWRHTAALHLPHPHSHGDACRHCTTDDHDEPWPCDAARLLAHIRGDTL